jgi:ribosomal protein L11 methyltransferase
MKKSFLEIEIIFDDKNCDIIYNRLYLEGISAILEVIGILKIYLPENESTLAEKIKNDLINLDNINQSKIVISKFDDHDWNKEWEKTIEPVYIKDRIIIYPSWKKNELIDTNGKILIEIDPKMSFGTGHNETTQLILEMMCDYINKNDKYLLDFGAGTGILSIAAVKLGVDNVVALDIDEDSIENAKEYFETNSVRNSIKLYKSDITEINESGFDVVTANITSGVITPLLKNIYSKLKTGGKLFITGILADETEEFIDNLSDFNFIVKEIREKAEWAGFYSFKK